MRNSLILSGVISLLLALNSNAAPVQLSGIGGQTTLAIVSDTNITNELTNTTPAALWDWGKIPLGHELNETSKKIVQTPGEDDEDNAWLKTRLDEMELETNEYT
jgi:hypothetical protein